MRKIWIVPLLLALSGSSQAEKYAGEFLSLGVGARSLAMGSAFVALSNDATALYWNPAGTSQMDTREVFLQHSERFGGIVSCDGASYVHPLKDFLGARSAIGFALLRLAVDDVALTVVPDPDELPGPQNIPEVDKRVGVSYVVGYLNYSRAVGERLSLGGSFKIVQADLYTASGLGAGADVGAIYTPYSKVSLGVSVRDATTTVLSWDTGTREYVMPTTSLGFAFNTPVTFPLGEFALAADVDLKFENRRKAASQFAYDFVSGESHLGAEYTYRKTVSGRIGVDTGHLTFGAGLFYRGFSFDYAHLDHDELGGTTRISGSYSF